MSFSDNLASGSFDFIKLNLGSKDFLLIDLRSSPGPIPDELARRLAAEVCPRRQGVGAAVLLVLQEGRDAPRLLEFVPGRKNESPGFDSLLVAGKYLFDTARFGTGPIPLETPEGRWHLDPMDSNSLRISLGKGGPSMSQSPEQGHRMSLQRGASVFFAAQAFQGFPENRKALKAFLEAGHGTTPVLLHLLGREEIRIKLPPGMPEADVVEASALGALAAYREGLCSHRLVIRCRKSQLFGEINPQTEELKITASVRYVFSGTYTLS